MSNLSRLLNPKSIALFGGAWAENVILQLQKAGFDGAIWPVHPHRETIAGVRCFKDLESLPAAPDASFIGVNRTLTVDIVEALSRMGAGGATCFASGFLESEAEETGGDELQLRLIEAAGDMPFLGPNCYGLINYLDGVTLWPDQHGGRRVESGVAIIGQSSNVLINMTMHKRGLPISHVVAAGNQAQTGISDIAIELLDDPRVSAIGLYIEGFGDIRKLEAMAAKAREMGKPVIAIKIGKSDKSRLATLTHTASLAGNSAASSALMKRLGIIEVRSVSVFLETLKLIHVCGPLSGNSVSSMSCSGGEAGLIADLAEGSNINFRGFSEKQYRVLKNVLGPIVTVANPLDYHTFIWDDGESLYACYRGVLEDEFDLNILIMDQPHDVRCDASAWQVPLEAIKKATRDTGANVALLATLPENLNEELSGKLMDAGIVPLHGMEDMIEAVSAAIEAGRTNPDLPKPVFLPPVMEQLSRLQSSSPESSDAGDTNTSARRDLTEAQSKEELASYGVPFPKSAVAKTAEAAAEASSALTFPVVLKGLGIAHKSEAGAVVLNLRSPEGVLNAASKMSGTDGFLVEEMVSDALAELLIGITRDPTGLYLLTISAGGIYTELLQDPASLLVPATRVEIEEAIERLRIAKVLNGYRGRPQGDKQAILDAVEAVQRYCLANPALIELDINPLIALEEGAVAVDALISSGA